MKLDSSFTALPQGASTKSAPKQYLDYLSLTKPEITFLVTISAFGGFMLGTAMPIEPSVLIGLLFGVALSSSGGAALNLYMEREEDARMKRTSDRPLPAGRIAPATALTIGGLCCVIGITILFVFTNAITAILSAATIVLYVFMYTPMKRQTKYNTLVGTIPGALPALGGWTAATGSFGFGGGLLFAILVMWQLPHFFALAWMYRKDYSRADFRMLPVVEPDGRSTAMQMLSASIILLFLSALPTFIGLTGLVYLVGATLVSAWVLFTSVKFYRSMSNSDARAVLKASILHIPVIVFLIFIDRFL